MSGFTAYPQRDSQMVGVPVAAKDTNYGANPIAGVRAFYFGGDKATLTREIVNFDVSPLSGRTVTAAKLIVVLSLANVSATAIISRCTRPADWVESEVTWNDYKVATPWTDGGGDFDDSGPPASVSYATHGSIDTEFEITGLIDFATDALDNRSGIVSLILRLDDEDPGSTEGEVLYTKEKVPLVTRQWRFVVDHDGAPIRDRERGFQRGVQRGVARGA